MTPTGRVFYYVQMPEADRTAIVVDWKSAWAYGAEHPTAARMGAALMTIGGTEHTLGSKGDCPAAAVGQVADRPPDGRAVPMNSTNTSGR